MKTYFKTDDLLLMNDTKNKTTRTKTKKIKESTTTK